MNPTSDPVNRVVTLTALCKVYAASESPLLEHIIAIMQRDTQLWLKQHPEHVHAFCDAFYDRRDDINTLAASLGGTSDDDNEWLMHNGVWTVLMQRYEKQEAFEKRLEDAGFRTLDLDAELKQRMTEDEIRQMDEESAAHERRIADDIATGRDQDWMMGYTFWLPDREEDYGEFTVGIPRRYTPQLARIHDYGVAGGRFPAREYTEYFGDLRSANVISETDHQCLMQWVDFKSQPKVRREAMKAASAYRPVTDLPEVTRSTELFSDYDGEIDELDDSDPLSISVSRREASRILELLERPPDRDEDVQKMLKKLRRSFDASDEE